MNGGYILIDMTKYSLTQLVAGVTIPGLNSRLKRAKKPVFVSIIPASNIAITIVSANVSIYNDGDVLVWAMQVSGDILTFNVSTEDLVTISA